MSIIISNEGLSPTFDIRVTDENNKKRNISIAGERPLIILVDGQEIVTLMTLATYPEALVLGYLRNQRLISSINELISIEVDWQKEQAIITTKNGIESLNDKIANKVVTTGCGQGTVFSCTMDAIYNQKLPDTQIKKSDIYRLLDNLSGYNKIYKSAGAVHTCALCENEQVIMAIEDVGRHNAADAISGLMWLNNIGESDKYIFYTTGRITSEIVMKVAQMRVSILLSRSGVTQMGLELAQQIGVLIIARAKGQHFLVFNEENRILFEQ